MRIHPYYRALPRRFRRPTLLIVGCGDVGQRLAAQLVERHRADRIRLIGVVRSQASAEQLRNAGIKTLVADLAHRSSARRLSALAEWMAMLAPPPNSGSRDTHSQKLLAALAQKRLTQVARDTTRRWTYVSTTGVYGDTAGARFDETRPIAPASARAIRRADAELQFRHAARSGSAHVAIVRSPGIYAQNRLPLERLRDGMPALHAEHDVYTNRIHADDLAHACWLALFRGRTSRIYHAVDDSDLKMGDYFDMVADAFNLPRPPRVSRDELRTLVTPMMLSFMSESRRLLNRRLHQELRCRLRYPDVTATLAAC